MENCPFIDDFPIKTSIYKGFSMAMLNNQRVIKHIFSIPIIHRRHSQPLVLKSPGLRRFLRGTGFQCPGAAAPFAAWPSSPQCVGIGMMSDERLATQPVDATRRGLNAERSREPRGVNSKVENWIEQMVVR